MMQVLTTRPSRFISLSQPSMLSRRMNQNQPNILIHHTSLSQPSTSSRLMIQGQDIQMNRPMMVVITIRE